MKPNNTDAGVGELRNKISAKIYGMYYYELPDNMSDAKEIVNRAAEVASQEVQRARIGQLEHVRDEWNKWLQFPEDTDEMKISDLVNHLNMLIEDIKVELKTNKEGR